HAPGQWIYAPKVATIQIISKGGEMKSETVSVSSNTEKTTTILSFDLSKIQLNEAYKIIIRVPNYGTIPQGQQGAGNKAWTFIDEIVIE
ncbi:MAG TPA: beta-N-acetylhexosaminidase, partial [Flavobacteriaceae bacterium]|nr:beta-N-acetylhexosaminidase [Flavobacteriaceae bacterium]